jgi:integrase
MKDRGGRGSIRKRTNADGSSAFEAYGRSDGKKKYLGTFPSRRAAEHRLEEESVHRRKVSSGQLPADMDTRRTFEFVAKEWLASEKRSRSLETYEPELERNVYPRLRNAAIVDVTAKVLAALQKELLDRPGMGKRTVAHTMAMAASICRYAWKSGYVAQNAGAMLDIVRFPQRAYCWIRTRAEIELLLGAVTDPHRTMFALLVMTGMRRSEALYLEWVDVDIEQRLICVQRGEHGEPKGKRLRYVPISDALLPVMRRWKLLSGRATGLVFPGRSGGLLCETGPTKMFKRAARRAGLDPAIRLHDLRHTYASHFIRDGGDIFRLSRYLGHASVLITERIYAHLAPDDYSQDWGRVAIRVQFDDARVIPIAGGQRESASTPLAIVDGKGRT